MNEYSYEVIQPENGSEVIKRTDAEGNEAWIPMVEGNSDYQAYLESLKPAPKTTKAE